MHGGGEESSRGVAGVRRMFSEGRVGKRTVVLESKRDKSMVICT